MEHEADHGYDNRSGDGARAHELSEQGKAHDRKQDQFDDEAALWIFNGEREAASKLWAVAI